MAAFAASAAAQETDEHAAHHPGAAGTSAASSMAQPSMAPLQQSEGSRMLGMMGMMDKMMEGEHRRRSQDRSSRDSQPPAPSMTLLAPISFGNRGACTERTDAHQGRRGSGIARERFGRPSGCSAGRWIA